MKFAFNTSFNIIMLDGLASFKPHIRQFSTPAQPTLLEKNCELYDEMRQSKKQY